MASSVREFRKRPVVIKALQWDGTSAGVEDVMAFMGVSRLELQANEGDVALPIKTLEGTMLASPGDWIICGVKGEFYPCKPDIFEATYEPCAVRD